MSSVSPKVLCAGPDLWLLKTRCAILARNGYDASAANLAETAVLLRTAKYDLIIISAGLTDSELRPLLAAAGTTPTYVLTGVTFAAKLLDEVGRRLQRQADLSKGQGLAIHQASGVPSFVL